MRSVSWLLVLAVGLAAACTSERGRPKSDGNGDGDDDGDDTGGSASMSSSSSAGGGGASATGSGGASPVEVHCDCLVNAFSVETCTACADLAGEGACAADLAACIGDAECDAALTVLLPQCGKETVTDKIGCVSQATSIGKGARDLLDAYAACLCATECATECAMPVVCTD